MIINVLYEFEPDGGEDIWIQVIKSSEETCNEPEHKVSVVFVVTDEVFRDSVKVNEMVVFTDIDVSDSFG